MPTAPTATATATCIVATTPAVMPPHFTTLGRDFDVDAMTLQLQSLTAQIAELATSDREWRRDSNIRIGELREADMMIQRRLEEVVTVTDTRLNTQDDRISTLTTMLSDLQSRVNINGSHFNPPEITLAAYPTGHPSQSTTTSYSSEQGKWFNTSRELPRETLSSSLGIIEMPVVSPVVSSRGSGESPDGPIRPLPTLAAVRTVSATGMMSPTQSPAAGQSQQGLFLPAVDSPTSVTTDPGSNQRCVTRASHRSRSDAAS
jgi:hypothetical protein